jgi:hypothetical protein
LAGWHIFDLFGIVKRIVGTKATIPLNGGNVSGHRHQHREADDCHA